MVRKFCYSFNWYQAQASRADKLLNKISELPPGARVISASSYGTSLWTRTAQVVTSLPDGTTKNYFLKV